MGPRVVVLGWDSATFDVVDPLFEQGQLPVLQSMAERGFRAPLRSTWPPMTDCAWTSAFTGVNPGRHGIFGSWYRAPGAYAPRYFSARDRRAPALWELGDGARFLVWNVPMSFPPAEIEGAMVAGYGAPPTARFCTPPELQDELAARWPLEDLLDRAPHGSLEAFLHDLLRGLEVQADALPWLARRVGADCVVAVWPHIDRAQHFFWRFRGTDHALASAVDRVYAAADRATGAVVEACGDADVLVVSDHGAGPLEGDVNVGAWLVDAGLAAYRVSRRPSLVDAAWSLPPALRRAARGIAPGLARRTVGATLAGQLGPFDWTRTRAFVGLHGDLWLNLEGRERSGTVPPSDAPALVDELVTRLGEVRDERTGDSVFAGVHRRDDIYEGDAVGLAPDLVLDSWTAGYRVAPRRGPGRRIVAPPSPLAGVREAWSSDHRPLGVLVAAGPRIVSGAAAEVSLLDVCPTTLALLRGAVPAGLDGRVAAAIDDGFLARSVTTAPAARRSEPSEYSDDEAAAVASHLRDLGYLE